MCVCVSVKKNLFRRHTRGIPFTYVIGLCLYDCNDDNDDADDDADADDDDDDNHCVKYTGNLFCFNKLIV